MHARHRSPGNGYRSGSMSMGLSASRISPEGSVRGHGLYNSEYRSFNRGFGRCQGQPKSFPSPSTPPRRSTGGDIFMEAGRLAAEYLVSQGFLAPSVLSGKWQNGSLKKQGGELQEFRSHDGENLHLPPPDVRPSALSRLGNPASDAGLGRRRSVDDYSSTGSRSHLKGRRKGGSFRYGTDFGREFGRSGTWSERNRASPDMEGADDTIPGHHEEQPVGKDVHSGIQKPGSGELATKVEEAGESETELDQYDFQDQTQSSSIGKDSPHDGEVSKKPENSPVELKNENDETQDMVAVEEETPHPEEGDSSGKKNMTDLLTLCKFPNLRTKTRSALMVKGLRSDSVSNNAGTTPDIKPPKGSEILVEDDPLNNSSRDLLSNKNHDLQLPDSDNSKALSVHEYGRALVPVEDAEQAKCHSYQSFSNRILVHDNVQEPDQGLTDLIRSTSMIQERGEKRAAEENDLREVAKRQREWLPLVASKPDECFGIPTVNEKEVIPEEEKPSEGEEVTMAVDHGSLVINSEFPLGGDEPCIQDAQEKQLFPGSFKICDLNLMGVADLNENNHNDPMLVFPPISEIKKEAGPVDVDLSMSSSNKSGEYSGHASNGKEIEVIDLENDPTQELKASDILDRKQQPVFVGFSNHTQNNGDITDVTDFNDGLMMVEFLNSLANLPHVTPGINPVPEEINHATQDVSSLQNEMSLHNGEGTLGDQGPLGDDDSIYMSLGEIPLSYLRGWEQPPPQEYEKPF